MYLQKLEIQGFKSFAKKTVFEFAEKSIHDGTAKSITAVVGPNGSGKSNVSDAIRWVLGEQSLKSIRCKHSEDVIFGGSEKKARQSFAEVAIYFNNEDKELPIEFPEVVITRRVFRDGETEYFINKKSVRLFDILMLLAKANFGQKSYSIIGQGMVDQIINISPFERKEFFDEATGVKQFQIKRDQAVGRLKRSRENLDQTNKIMIELEPRLRLLARQVKKLEQRKEIEIGLRQMQKNYYSYLWQNLTRDFSRERESFGVKDAVKADSEKQLFAVQNKLALLAKEESRKDVFNNLQKDFNKLSSDKNDLLRELAVIKGKMSLEYVKAGKQNLSWLENKKEEIGTRVSEIKESLENAENKLRQNRDYLSSNEDKFTELQKEILVLQNNLLVAQEDLMRLKTGERQSYGYESVKALLRQKSFINGILGTVAELAKTEKMYENALAVAAGNNRLMAIVVQNDETAVKCINFLKQNRLPPATFFPLNKIQGWAVREDSRTVLQETGAIGFAIDLLSFDQKYRKVYELIFGSTLVVDNLENAKRIGVGREKMVTLDGDLLEKTGVMKGGFRKNGGSAWISATEENRLIIQEEKIKEIAVLQNKIQTISRERELLGAEISEARVQSQVGETKIKGLTNDLESLKKEKSQLESEIAENRFEPGEKDKFFAELELRRRELDAKVESLDAELSKSRKQIDDFNMDEERKKNEVFSLQREMQEAQLRLNQFVTELNDVKINLARLETKRDDLEKEIKQELGEVNINEIKPEEVSNVDQLWFEISKQKHNLELIGGIDDDVIVEHKEVSERYEFLSVQVKDLEKAITDLDKIVNELDEVIAKQFNATFKKINQAFGTYFEKIFGGGKAKLEILQKDKPEVEVIPGAPDQQFISDEPKSDALDIGIDIMAAPPNKKVANIAMLSGGERTMTSLALICAIIDSNPAPFIVMDEVDAALDEANSEKLAEILQSLSFKSQFVVITHNRVIMHVADVLYGVAMGDDGVTKTLSLDMKEAQKSIE